MGVIVCRHCQARNTEGGDCVMCQRPLGNLPAAIAAAFGAAALLATMWGGFSYLTGLQAVWFAALFGGLVSGAVAVASSGRGPLYQVIATTATIVGIVAGEVLLIVLLDGRTELHSDHQVVAEIALTNPYGMAFAVVGVLGGLWLWRDGPSE